MINSLNTLMDTSSRFPGSHTHTAYKQITEHARKTHTTHLINKSYFTGAHPLQAILKGILKGRARDQLTY